MDTARQTSPIPSQLRETPKHWVCWLWEEMVDKKTGEAVIDEKTGKPKRTKVPYHAVPGERRKASTIAPPWRDYGDALRHAARFDGIGFVLTGTEITAFDIDDCRDPKTGVIHAWAQRKINEAATYAEVTPSGTGIRIIGTGTGSEIHIKRPVEGGDGVTCELYRRAERYIAMTGDHLDGTPPTLANIDALMDATFEELTRGPQQETRERLTAAELRGLIKHGDIAGRYRGDRSAAVFAVILALLAKGQSEEEIVGVITDPKNGISAHILENGGEAAARRQIKRALDKRKAEADANARILAAFNEKFAVVSDGGKTRVLSFVKDSGRDVATFARFDDFRNFHRNVKILTGTGEKALGNWWLDHPQRRTYRAVVFEPNKPKVVDGALNLWRGFGVEPRRSVSKMLLDGWHSLADTGRHSSE